MEAIKINRSVNRHDRKLHDQRQAYLLQLIRDNPGLTEGELYTRWYRTERSTAPASVDRVLRMLLGTGEIEPRKVEGKRALTWYPCES